jgi:putative protein kinase ArgK-like GTPase of G3E family
MAAQTFRGRAREVARALHVLGSARSDGHGAVLSVTGEPGIGKSALLEVIRGHALETGYAVGFGKADEATQIAAGAPVLQALRSGPRSPALSCLLRDFRPPRRC